MIPNIEEDIPTSEVMVAIPILDKRGNPTNAVRTIIGTVRHCSGKLLGRLIRLYRDDPEQTIGVIPDGETLMQSIQVPYGQIVSILSSETE